MDQIILKVCSKYRLDYTRYADDLTFSTNVRSFLTNKEQFLNDISRVIKKSGFTINDSKTTFKDNRNRQMVTGLVVNDKISVPVEFYKNTRAMVHRYLLGQEIMIDGSPGTVKQLEGRLNYINDVCRYNNTIDAQKHNAKTLSAREKVYQSFLMQKHIVDLEKPTILSEGKTDIRILKAVLKSLKHQPSHGMFQIPDIRFFNRTSLHQYYLNISKSGGSISGGFFDLIVTEREYRNKFFGNNLKPDYMSDRRIPKQPIILLFDNERDKDKPLRKALKACHKVYHNIEINDLQKNLDEQSWTYYQVNIYIATLPPPIELESLSDFEIEDLLQGELKKLKKEGKTINRSGDTKGKNYISKNKFSTFILENYEKVDFGHFLPLINVFNQIIFDYQSKVENQMYNEIYF